MNEFFFFKQPKKMVLRKFLAKYKDTRQIRHVNINSNKNDTNEWNERMISNQMEI